MAGVLQNKRLAVTPQTFVCINHLTALSRADQLTLGTLQHNSFARNPVFHNAKWNHQSSLQRPKKTAAANTRRKTGGRALSLSQRPMIPLAGASRQKEYCCNG